jgi:hypothetical protein
MKKPIIHKLFLIPCILFFTVGISVGQPIFKDVASQTGLQGIINHLQFGMAWGDFDNDGDDDLFVASNPVNQLFRNNGDGTFTDIAANANVDDPGMIATVGIWGDYNNDGYLDLFVANTASSHGAEEVRNRLYRNNTDGTFSEVGTEMGVAEISHNNEEDDDDDHLAVDHESSGSVGASWADYDGDGWLDLLVCNRHAGLILFRNSGQGPFLHQTKESNLVLHSHDEQAHHEINSIGCEHAIWGDYDNDSDLDLFVCVAVIEEHETDHEHANIPAHEHAEEKHLVTENRFFENNGDGTFTDRTDDLNLGDPNEAVSHTALWFDYNNDGHIDLFVANLGSYNQDTAAPSRLYRNNGDRTFTEVAEAVGLTDKAYPLGALAFDFNNDGYLDLQLIHHPSHEDFQAGEFYRTPHPLFQSNFGMEFSNINADIGQAIFETGITDINHAIGLAASDYNQDGTIDFLISENHGDGPIRLYQNTAPSTNQNWVQIRPRQAEKNKFAIGAKIQLETSQGLQTRLVGIGNHSFASQNSLTAHFGLGSDTQAHAFIVWPNGEREDFGIIAANQLHVMTAGNGQTVHVHDWIQY